MPLSVTTLMVRESGWMILMCGNTWAHHTAEGCLAQRASASYPRTYASQDTLSVQGLRPPGAKVAGTVPFLRHLEQLFRGRLPERFAGDQGGQD